MKKFGNKIVKKRRKLGERTISSEKMESRPPLKTGRKFKKNEENGIEIERRKLRRKWEKAENVRVIHQGRGREEVGGK